MPFNFPIFLTWLRIVLIPLVVGVFYLPDVMMSPDHRNLLAMVIFVLAALTDWFDGYLARKLNQTSAFGAFLDPVADKLMVTGMHLEFPGFGYLTRSGESFRYDAEPWSPTA